MGKLLLLTLLVFVLNEISVEAGPGGRWKWQDGGSCPYGYVSVPACVEGGYLGISGGGYGAGGGDYYGGVYVGGGYGGRQGCHLWCSPPTPGPRFK